MKTTILTCFALTSVALQGTEVTVHVMDDDFRPFSGASALVGFAMVRLNSDEEYKGMTDQRGNFSAHGRAEYSVYARANAPGHYEAWLRNLSNEQDLNLTVMLRRIINPVSLYALNFRAGGGGPPLSFPIQDEWLGYDFAAGDWTKPYGKGEIADIRFKFHHEFKGWNYTDKEMAELRQHPYNRNKGEEEIRLQMGKWEGELEISFPGEKEGLCEETERFLSYSELKMPHSAPDEGYKPALRYSAATGVPRETGWDTLQKGFFIRSRVKLDKEGKIVSANYAKIMGDFQFDARGFVMFSYYFNPTPNDRNLEFDPKKNLFPANFPGAQVSDP